MSFVEVLLRSGFPAEFLLLGTFAVVVAALLLLAILSEVRHERRVRKE